jgi:ribonucleoside-diphosphate reductase alpha chain
MSDLLYLNDDFDSTVDRILQDDGLKSYGLNKRKVSRTLKSFEGDEIASTVFLKKYALRDENDQIVEFTLEEAKDRWAKENVKLEEKVFKSDKKSFEYYRELYDYFLPGGRQMFALGNKYIKNASMTNCYVTAVDDDSIEGIFEAAKKIAKTYSYGGGIGFCIGNLRPKSAKVSNTARYSTGAVSFMELYSMTTGLIGQSGRRGALLLSIPVNHPDIEDFIDIKYLDKTKVQFANISIKISNEFMKAVIEDLDFELKFETKHEKISKIIKARVLWNKIINSARNSAEPGLLFWDNITNDSPTDVYDELKVVCTNPCGELPLGNNFSCLLGSLLLYKFVKSPFSEKSEFDYETFSKIVERAVRHLDNVIELNAGKHPLEEQERAAKLSRRIGLGITGLADMFSALNIVYDSNEALEICDKIMKIKMEAEYRATIQLSKERGAFPLFDSIKHYSTGFCSRLSSEIKELGKKYGQRNSGISTVAPSGSISIISQCSSGIEPIFALVYKRYVEMGGEKKEFIISHPGVNRYRNITGNNKLSDIWKTAHDVDYKHRIKLQSVIQKYTDASISSTINLPNNTTVETVGQIYIDAWKEGLKGITVYREGSREGVLLTNFESVLNTDTVVNCVKAEGGDKFYIIVSYQDKIVSKPYQVFVMNYKKTESESFIKIANNLIKMLKDNGVSEERIQKYIDRSNNPLVKLTRFLSLSMKTDNLSNAVKVLEEHSFAGTLSAKLYDILSKSVEAKKSTCPICKGTNIKAEEGCVSCLDCHWSKCT